MPEFNTLSHGNLLDEATFLKASGPRLALARRGIKAQKGDQIQAGEGCGGSLALGASKKMTFNLPTCLRPLRQWMRLNLANVSS